MKTKVLKNVMPFIVMILAVGFSFAVDENRVVQTGYYDNPDIPGIQSTATNCVKNGNGALCKVGIFQLFDTPTLTVGEELKQP